MLWSFQFFYFFFGKAPRIPRKAVGKKMLKKKESGTKPRFDDVGICGGQHPLRKKGWRLADNNGRPPPSPRPLTMPSVSWFSKAVTLYLSPPSGVGRGGRAGGGSDLARDSDERGSKRCLLILASRPNPTFIFKKSKRWLTLMPLALKR